MRNLVVLDAPSGLGPRPPAPGTVPDWHKLAGACASSGREPCREASSYVTIYDPDPDPGPDLDPDGTVLGRS